MTLDAQQIYQFLPAVYRVRDTDEQGPLQALVAIIAEQFQVLEDSLEQAYDDQFIETCAEWVIPYIGALVGSGGLNVFPNAQISLRGQVANTLPNRRRKGTIFALEEIARDLTGWDANAVEFFQLLATTQYAKHPRPGNLSFPAVRGADSRLIGTPFDTEARTADVHNIQSLRGRYNIPNIGIFLWRIPSRRVEVAPAYSLDARRFLFDPFGRDIVLQTHPVTRDGTKRILPINVAMPILRRVLFDDLEAHPNAATDASAQYYGPDASVFLLYSLPASPPIALPVASCNLSDVTDGSGNVVGWAHQPAGVLAIDPQLGRISFPPDHPPPTTVHGIYCYGFSAEIGGGPYERDLDDSQDVLVRVPHDTPSIQAALDQAIAQLVGDKTKAVIEIQDSEYYFEAPSVLVPANAQVTLRAASEVRPTLVLAGDFTIAGLDGSTFEVDGLWVGGGSLVLPATAAGNPNRLDRLSLSHCTLLPRPTPRIGAVPAQPVAPPRLWIEAAAVSVDIAQCVMGSIRAIDGCDVSITGSIVDAMDPTDVAYAGLDSIGPAGQLTVNNSTVIGKVHASMIALASNTIFFARLAPADPWPSPVLADQLQQGCVRFSFVPPGSQVPRCFQCRPGPDDPPALAPQFTSIRCGDPGYCQLAAASGVEILQGADDQSEMGVFHDLFQPQREANLRNNLPEYLRFGLQAGLFHAS
jgi:hypothetical protein